MIRATTEISKKLCSLGVLKMMVAILTKSFVEELMIKPPSTSPSRIRVQEHQMVMMKNQIISNIRLGSIAEHRGLFINELFDHIR